nr:hypothetical protein [Tanacetum cinerariifolium]
MSSDNTPSTVTYTSISSDSDGPSWGIPLMNAEKLSEIDPYKEVTQQGQAPPLSPAYVPDPMKLDEHVPVYILEPEHLECHVPSDDDMQVEDQPYANDALPITKPPGHIADSESMEEDSIDCPDEPEDDDEDPEEDHTDYPADGADGDYEPSDEDDDDDIDDYDEEPTKDEDDDEEEEEHLALTDSSMVPVVDSVPLARDTEAFETDKSAPTPRSPQTRIPFSQTRLCRKIVRLKPPISASIEARIAKHAGAPISPTSPAYDQAPLGHKVTMIRMRDDIPKEDMPPQRIFVLTAPPPRCNVVESSAAAARPPRGQYDFVDTVEARQGFIRSPSHDAWTIARAADRVEDLGYVRALQASEHRMMTSIEEVNLRISYQAQVCRQESEDFYTQLHNAWTDRRDIRLKIDEVRGQGTAYETELHESVKDLAIRQMMPIHVLEARAQIDMVEDTGTSCIVGLSQWLKKMESVFHISSCAVNNQVKFATCTMLGAALTWWNGHVRTSELALMCTKFLANETEKVDKYIHGNVMSPRPKTLDDDIELANDLMDQKLHTYTKRENDNKRKADGSSRNNQQQQCHKKQNVARAYTAGPRK